jgi:hypothetical protein
VTTFSAQNLVRGGITVLQRQDWFRGKLSGPYKRQSITKAGGEKKTKGKTQKKGAKRDRQGRTKNQREKNRSKNKAKTQRKK